MNTRILISIIIVVSLVSVGILAYDNSNINEKSEQQNSSEQEEVTNIDNCLSEDCLKIDDLEYPAGVLPDTVVEALDSAIDDEYKAHATYEAVINKLGSTRPFSMIIRAEEKHISSLKAIYDKYDLEIPEDPYQDVQIAETRAQNCSIGVQAEIDNAALYRDSLLPAVSDYPDISSVFTQLMNASQDNHLPAFEKCAG